MKYILIFLGAIILARIDLVIHGLETFAEKFSKVREVKPKIEEINLADENLNRDLIPIKSDPVLVRTVRFEFFTLLEDFRLNPISETRTKIRSILESHTLLFQEKLDKDLEAQIYKMIDLFYNKNKEFSLLLVDLMSFLKDENKGMVKKFFTILLDTDVEQFMSSYSRTDDLNCMVAKEQGFQVPEEEILNELIERQEKIDQFLNSEGKDPALVAYATKCRLVLNLEITKLSPDIPEEEPSPNEENNINP